ncbi:MAG: restriction endonuclease [Methylocystis sp.]
MRSYRVARRGFQIGSGQGAAIFGGQWNSPGSLIYSADTVATALLETFVERPPDNWPLLAMAEFEIPDHLIERPDPMNIPTDLAARRAFGDNWLQHQASVALMVPSARVAGARIVLLNPGHPDFRAVSLNARDMDFESKFAQGELGEQSIELIRPSTLSIVRWPGLVAANGEPLNSNQAKIIQLEIGKLEAALLAHVRSRPEVMHELTPREFEQMIGAFYEERGWNVQLTPASKDGGKDLIIVKSDEAGRRICYVECKRYAYNHPVGVAIVRQLYGVVERDSATSGIVVTTSSFTKGARKEGGAFAHRMTLHDYEALVEMFKRSTTR